MHQIDLFEYLAENYNLMPESKVNIEGVINTRTLSDFTIQTTYRDIFLIINILDDYVNLLQQNSENNGYTNYMIEQFARISKELSEQIELDKEKMHKRYHKKVNKDDVGEDALNLLMSRGDNKD